MLVLLFSQKNFFFSYFISNLVLLVEHAVGNFVVVDVDVLEKVDPIFLVGILVGVLPSSLTRDKVEPCLEAGLDVGLDELGVKLDRIGIDVFVVIVVVNVFEGVRRPYEAESEWSESAVDPVRDFTERSC